MWMEALLDLVVYNLPCFRSPLGVTSPKYGKPFFWEAPPFLPALLHQLHNCLEVAWAMDVVFMHVLLGSRLAVFVEENFLVAD